MKCLRCQAESPAGTRFCGQCAAPLASVCGSCGATNPPDNKFCGQCAAPLAEPARPRFAAPESYTPRHLAEKMLTSRTALEGERKQVTVLFADLKGSMELLADRDPEEARRILDPILEQMMEAVHWYEGTVNQVMGDGIMALFGAPLAHEDHAVRACYAALRMQESIKRYGEGVRRQEGILPQIRVGLNSGEVVVRSIGSDLHIDYTAVGETTHLAARVEQAATPASVLITAATLQLAEGHVQVVSLGPVSVKGRGKPVDVYELTGAGTARSRFQVLAGRGLTKFVGRAGEIRQLGTALEQSYAGRGQVVAVVGEPGVGKVAPLLGVHALASHGALPDSRRRIDLLRQGDELPAGDRAAPTVFSDRGVGRQAKDPRKGDRKAPLAGPGARAVTRRAAGLARGVGRRRGVDATGTARTPPADARGREASPAPRKPRAAARGRVRGSSLDRLREPGRGGQPRGKPARRSSSAPRQLPTRVPARVGQQDVLHPATHGSAGAHQCARSFSASGSAPMPRSMGSSAS